MLKVKFDSEMNVYVIIGEEYVVSVPQFYTSPNMEVAFKSGDQEQIINALKDYNEHQKRRVERLANIIKYEKE